MCTAAFLRCLHAAIEYAPNDELQRAAIETLQIDQVFSSITQLCSTTGWLDGSIGLKYLRVFKYVIRMPMSAGYEKKENLIKYEIFSLVVERLLLMLKSKITSASENLVLTTVDKMTIALLSSIVYEMSF